MPPAAASAPAAATAECLERSTKKLFFLRARLAMSGKHRCVFRPARAARLLPRAPPHTARPPNLPKMATPSRARDSRTPGVWPRRRHGCSSRGASFGKTLLRPLLHPTTHRRTERSEKSEFPECDCDRDCQWSQSQNIGSMIDQNMIAATGSAATTAAREAAAGAAGTGAAETEAPHAKSVDGLVRASGTCLRGLRA